MVLKVVTTIGSLKTLGEPHGDKPDTFGSTSIPLPMILVCAELTLAPVTQLLERKRRIFETSNLLHFFKFNLMIFSS